MFILFKMGLFLFIQILIVELSIELLRIATVHTPQSLSNAMGLIAAILLGEFAIQLGFLRRYFNVLCYRYGGWFCNTKL